MDLPMAKLIKLAKNAGVIHKADNAYSVQSTWWLHLSATDVPFTSCAISLPCIFTHYLDLSISILESGLSYSRVFIIFLLLVCFVSAAGCYCFDFLMRQYWFSFICLAISNSIEKFGIVKFLILFTTQNSYKMVLKVQL